MPAVAYINPRALRWAREPAACSLEEAAKVVGRPVETVEEWESPRSNTLPTVRQAQKLAGAYGVPFPQLYVDHLPLEPDFEAVPEFRGLDPELGQVRPHSRQLRRMIKQAEERQALAVELLGSTGQSPLLWVGSATPGEDPELLGDRIREDLGEVNELPATEDRERLLDWWVELVERLGAIVSRYRPDGNRYWAVEPSEARGLSLCHTLAPYIVLNSRDAPAGRIFTLMHELAHLYFGQCGVDDIGDERLLPADARFLEQRCNQVAAAILMPADQFIQAWESASGEVRSKVGTIANRFGVSRQAAAVRAKSDAIGLISSDEYEDMSTYLSGEYREFRENRALATAGGGMTVPVRVFKDFGARYVGLICDAHDEGMLSLLDAAEALGARAGDVDSIRIRLR
jgi:Zn-dependent peptidase ImmA (M78 family)